jgi:FkbM family methyltransferase
MSQIPEGLARLRQHGFHPENILDIGAYQGWFARQCRPVWPDANILMIDALAEKEAFLRSTCGAIGNADYLIALLGGTAQPDVAFHVVHGGTEAAPIKTGSSKYREKFGVPTEEIRLPQRTLDDVVAGIGRRFALVKLDIQGAELEVLAASPRVLAEAEVVLLELSLLDYNEGAPLIAEALGCMAAWGFVLYDIIDLTRLGPDLNQIDGLFVRPDSPLRRRFKG